jgi:hypothetical protein
MEPRASTPFAVRLLYPVVVLTLLPGAASRTFAENITISRVAAPPRIADYVPIGTARPADELTRVQELVQRRPADGAPVSEATAVYLGYDAANLYALFVCSAPAGAVRAHMVNRDRIPDDDDSIALQLDTFHDGRRLYGFQVNPAGVQVDGVYTDGKGWDLSFDTVWTAEAAMTRSGYVVLITVPFASVRFPDSDEHRWGLFVYRGIPRKNEEAFWPAYPLRYQGRLPFAAELDGIREINRSETAQIVPYAAFRGAREHGAAARNAGTNDFVAGRQGADLKAIVRESLVVDLAANPDFSQVESDEPQTTVNQRFEVFFPEKRPFFLENASYFETPFQVLFTRRIQQPRVGARVSGKVGRYAFGALVADDVAGVPASPGADADGRALTSVVRVSRDLRTDSQAGLLYIRRAQGAFDNQVAGADARWRFTRGWVASGQMVVSHTASGRDASDGRAFSGTLSGNGRLYTYELAATDVSPRFLASSGYIPRTDIREVRQTGRVTFRPAGSRISAWGPGVVLSRIWDHGNHVLDSNARLEANVELPRQTTVTAFTGAHDELIRPHDLPGLSSVMQFDQRLGGITVGSAPFTSLAFSGECTLGTAVNLDPAGGALPSLARSRGATLTASVRPTPAITVDSAYLWTELREREGGGVIFSNAILRSRANVQVTRRLSVRAIVQTERLNSEASRSSLEGRRDTNVDVLFTYLVQPGTAIYVGVNADRRGVSRERAEQVFVKLSYLVRF